MTVSDLIAELQRMPGDAEVRLHASFDGMCGSGPLALVTWQDDYLATGVALYDEEMSEGIGRLDPPP